MFKKNTFLTIFTLKLLIKKYFHSFFDFILELFFKTIWIKSITEFTTYLTTVKLKKIRHVVINT